MSVKYLLVILYFAITLVSTFGFSFEARAVARSNALVTNSLYNILKDEPVGNLLISPYTFITALLALRSGSRGSTSEIIKYGLQLENLDEHVIDYGYQDIITSFQGTRSANYVSQTLLLVPSSFVVKPEFMSHLQNRFNASVSVVNFGNATETEHAVGAWANSTGIDRESISETFTNETQGVLLSFTKFLAPWKKKFGYYSTRMGQFFLDNNERISVKMMNHDDYFHYAQLPELDSSAVMLPFQGDRFGFIIVLPNRRTGLASLETNLKDYPLTDIPKKLTRRWVEVWLPKFKLEMRRDYLQDATLAKMRMGSISYPVADFTGISCDNELHFRGFVQRASIEINEEGTAGSEPSVLRVEKVTSRQGVTFNVEHPFLFFIYDHLTKSVLLLGRKAR